MSQMGVAVTLVTPPTDPASISTLEESPAIMTVWSGTAVVAVVAASVVESQVGCVGSVPLVRLAATAPAKRSCGLTGPAGRQPTATTETTRIITSASTSHHACGERRTPDRQRFVFTVLPLFRGSSRGQRGTLHGTTNQQRLKLPIRPPPTCALGFERSPILPTGRVGAATDDANRSYVPATKLYRK